MEKDQHLKLFVEMVLKRQVKNVILLTFQVRLAKVKVLVVEHLPVLSAVLLIQVDASLGGTLVGLTENP